MVQGRRKPFAERSLTPSRVRTAKKGRKTRRRQKVEYSPAVRTKPTTGREVYEPGSVPEYRRPIVLQLS